ncbi:MAG: hypothetical protein [Betabaculovirus sp.]|nr:MAG: hypothetical protein [Betabaculovirus sp.]
MTLYNNIDDNDYKHASMIINIISCVLQFLQIVLVITFAVYKFTRCQ